MQALEQWQSFSKNSHRDLDLEPRTLDVEPVQDIIKSNICVKLYKNPSIYAGARAITKLFFK